MWSRRWQTPRCLCARHSSAPQAGADGVPKTLSPAEPGGCGSGGLRAPRSHGHPAAPAAPSPLPAWAAAPGAAGPWRQGRDPADRYAEAFPLKAPSGAGSAPLASRFWLRDPMGNQHPAGPRRARDGQGLPRSASDVAEAGGSSWGVSGARRRGAEARGGPLCDLKGCASPN